MPSSLPQRRSIRIQGYDYTFPGAYFVTMVTCRRECILGTISNDPEPEVSLTSFGRVVLDVWNNLARSHANLGPGQLTIMPNHVHLLVTLRESPSPAPLPVLVGVMKTYSSRRINALRRTPGQPVWQRNFYEHVIRDNADWCAVSAYMRDNPRRWKEDEEYRESSW